LGEGDSYKENVASVLEGRADVCFGIPTSPTVFDAEKHPIGIRWIDMNSAEDPEGAARFRAIDPLIDLARCLTACRPASAAGAR